MSNTIRILHLEDDPAYLELVQSLLEHEGLSVNITVVPTVSAFKAAVGERDYDLILADYRLPDSTGLEALAHVRERDGETPFVLVSGTIAEQAAIDSLRSGATDYVLKHWPERLVPAVRRALKEAEDRKRRQQAETELHRQEQYFRTLTENSLDIVSVLDPAGRIVYSSPSLQRVLGYHPDELKGRDAWSIVHAEDLEAVQAAFRRGLENPAETITVQMRLLHKDGEWRHLEAIGQSHLEDPQVRAVVINLRDVTDRHLAEESIRENEKQYRLIFDDNPTPMWVFDHETLAFLEVNDEAVKHYGYSRQEFLSMAVSDLRPDGEAAMIEYWHRLFHDQPSARMGFAGTWEHRKKDGSVITVEVKWCPILFKGREASLSMINDITERRKAEHRDQALSALGHRLSSAATPTEAAQIIKSVADELFPWDAFLLNLYSAEENRITPILNIDTERDGQRFNADLSGPDTPSPMTLRVIQHGAELILRDGSGSFPAPAHRIGDLSRLSASLMYVPIRNRTRVIGVLSIQSYTPKVYSQSNLMTLQTLADHCGGALERIRAEQALHESEQRFRDLFEGSPDAIFVESPEGVILDVNPAACRLHGMARGALIGKHASELVPPSAAEQVKSSFKNLVSGHLRYIEGHSLNAEGVPVPVEIKANPVQYGGRAAVLLHVRDVTERRRAEQALRSSEILFHSVWENSVDGLRLTDEFGNIVAVNDAYCRLVGKPRSELEGKPFSVVYAPQERPEQLVQDYQVNFRNGTIDRQRELPLVLHNGQTVILEYSSSIVAPQGRSPLLFTLFRDVTAQRRLEEQLRQSQKMEAIGQLAGGVAHDFNNILTVIHGHASLLLAAGNLGPNPSRSAQQIGQAAERAASLTRQLLAFGRRQVLQPRLLDLNEIVANISKMLGRLLGEDVALQLNYSSSPAMVKADAGMLEQILLNLAVNSRDAMPRGGVLRLRIANVEIEAVSARRPEAKAGSYVCLTATDTGYGISPENLPRIFEPFFTTKEVGKGTGLGLSMVYGIVQQHNGWIEVESELEQGTTFRIYLPRTEHALSTAPAFPVAAPLRGGKETILVVEDEAPVRELVCALLEHYGYRILQAESGVKALEIWSQQKGSVDLVLTDLVMPDRINGRELAERLWSERPDLKVIFTSGYSADVVGKDFVLQNGLNYLQKPYQPQRLATAIRDCLDAVN